MNGSWARVCFLTSILALAAQLTGCLLTKALTVPVKVAATTVIVVGDTAVTVVKATGKVAKAAVSAGGSVTSTGIESVAQLSQVGMVTFVDAASGAIVRIPWEQGLTLAQAKNLSAVQVARRSVDLIRAGKVVYAAKRYSDTAVPLVAGDVVRLTP